MLLLFGPKAPPPPYCIWEEEVVEGAPLPPIPLMPALTWLEKLDWVWGPPPDGLASI